MPDIDAMSVESWMRASLLRNAETVASDLENLAKQVRQNARMFEEVGTRPGNTDYLSTATGIVKRIQWAVPNLGLDRLLRDAGEADTDRAVRKALAAAEEPS